MAVRSISTIDGLRLFTRHWCPAGPVQARIVLVHGYAEHSGRYDHVATSFSDVGAATYAFDLRGHGQSEGRRVFVDRFDQYLDDLARVLSWVRAEGPNRPLFLFGHSMGGLIALKFVLDRSPNLQGLILSAPALEVNPDLAPLLRRIAGVLGTLAPTLPTARSPQEAISRDPQVVAEAIADPLNYHGRIPARTGAELIRAGATVRGRLDELTTPFLVIHGTADPLTAPRWSRRLHTDAPSEDKTIHLYEGLYHESFNEPEQERVLRDLRRWVASRLPGADVTA
ncbi:MAG: alpha/beta hydrolase [Salinibacter sp.]